MIFLFRDNIYGDKYTKVTAQDEKEAILKVLKVQLDRDLISVEEICGPLEYTLINTEELEEHE